MIIDTIFIFVLCLPQPNTKTTNRFAELFEKADKNFDIEYKLDVEKLKKASEEAVKSASIKTSAEREKVLDPLNITPYFIKETKIKKTSEYENRKK